MCVRPTTFLPSTAACGLWRVWSCCGKPLFTRTRPQAHGWPSVGDLPAHPLPLLSTGGIHVIFVAASLRRARWLSALVLAVLACTTARADLFEYVKKEEPNYA